jgi:hypothetical protein
MNIVWQYLDKRSAAISALKDYGSMAYILEHTGEDIALVQDRMTAPRASVLSGMPSAHNPTAGEARLASLTDDCSGVSYGGHTWRVRPWSASRHYVDGV